MRANIIMGQKTLLEALTRLVDTCLKPGQQEIDFLMCIRFEGLGSRVLLSAQNAQRRVDLFVEGVTPHAPFCTGLPGKTFYQIVRSLSGDINIEYIDVTGACYISTEKSSFCIKTLPESKFPHRLDLPFSPGQHSVAGVFGAFSKVSYCCASDEASRAYARSVCVTRGLVFATNGYRISTYPNTVIDCPGYLLIHKDAVTCFQKVFKGVDDAAFCCYDEGSFYVGTKNIMCSAQLCVGIPPDVEVAIPKSQCDVCVVGLDDLLDATKRAVILSGTDKAVSFTVSDQGKIRLNVFNGLDKFSENVDCKYSGKDFTTVLNTRYLKEALEAIDDDGACLELRGHQDAVVITDSTGRHRNVILPYRRSQ